MKSEAPKILPEDAGRVHQVEKAHTMAKAEDLDRTKAKKAREEMETNIGIGVKAEYKKTKELYERKADKEGHQAAIRFEDERYETLLKSWEQNPSIDRMESLIERISNLITSDLVKDLNLQKLIDYKQYIQHQVNENYNQDSLVPELRKEMAKIEVFVEKFYF